MDFMQCPKCENTIWLDWQQGPGIFLRTRPQCTVTRCGWKADNWMNSKEVKAIVEEQERKAELEQE